MSPPATAGDPPGTSRTDVVHKSMALPIEPGLHLIATPIGTARDITLRALDLLAGADVLAAEDTRSLRRLMELHGVSVAGRPVLAYHDHNGPKMRPRLLSDLAQGKTVVYASEAGTPLVADPGFQLVRDAVAAGHTVRAAPGPSAVLAALTVSGLPSDRFCFMGFAPAQHGARQTFLREAASIPATVIFYESPKRVKRLLDELVQHMGKERAAALCRELTKRFEEVLRMPLGALADHVGQHEMRGEIVVLVGRAHTAAVDAETVEGALDAALKRTSLKEAVAEVSAAFDLPRRDVYQTALRLRGRE